MTRLFVLVLIALAAWYGWKHYDQLLHPQKKHEAVIRNETGQKVVRIRLAVGGHTYAKEELAAGESATIPFTVDKDSEFDLVWEYDTNTNTGHWNGGMVARGPLVGRHTLTIQDGGGVVMENEGY